MLFDDPEDDLADSAGDTEEKNPVFDEPEGLPVPRMAMTCLGHADIEKKVLGFYNSGKMPHALIFSGIQGIGKSTFAFRLAKFLLTHKPAEDAGPSLFGDPLPAVNPENLDSKPDAQAVQLIHSGGHPDLLVLERQIDEDKGRQKESISVEQVRNVPAFLQLTPAMGGWRIVIIDDADTMTRNSQNALLKVLEEPPANTLLILVAHRLGQMIPTIRSRSRVLDFSCLSMADFSTLMKLAMPSVSPAQTEILHDISSGSIGMSLRLMQEGALKSLDRITMLLNDWPKINWADVHMAGEVLGGKGNTDFELQGFQDVLLWVATRLTHARACGTPLPTPLNQGPYPDMLARFSLMEWVKIHDDLKSHFDTVKYGTLDKRQAVFGAISILKQAA